MDSSRAYAEKAGRRPSPISGRARRPPRCPAWCRADHADPSDEGAHAGQHLEDDKVRLLRADGARRSGRSGRTTLWLDGAALGIDADGRGVSLTPAEALDLAAELIAKASDALRGEAGGDGPHLMEAALYALQTVPVAARATCSADRQPSASTSFGSRGLSSSTADQVGRAEGPLLR